jgi:hypothetical protein
MEHNTSAYNDGQKWLVYCVNCGLEENALTATSCDQRYVVNKFVSDGDKKKVDKVTKPK